MRVGLLMSASKLLQQERGLMPCLPSTAAHMALPLAWGPETGEQAKKYPPGMHSASAHGSWGSGQSLVKSSISLVRCLLGNLSAAAIHSVPPAPSPTAWAQGRDLSLVQLL